MYTAFKNVWESLVRDGEKSYPIYGGRFGAPGRLAVVVGKGKTAESAMAGASTDIRSGNIVIVKTDGKGGAVVHARI